MNIRQIMGILAAILILVGSVSAQTADIVLSFNPSAATVPAGSTFTIDVLGDSSVDVSAIGVTFVYNPAVVHVLDVVPSSAFPLHLAKTIDNAAGTTRLDAGVALTTPPSPASGTFTLCTLELQAVGVGVNQMMAMDLIAAEIGQSIPIVIEAGTVTVIPPADMITIDVALPLQVVQTLPETGAVTVTIGIDSVTIETDTSSAEWR